MMKLKGEVDQEEERAKKYNLCYRLLLKSTYGTFWEKFQMAFGRKKKKEYDEDDVVSLEEKVFEE